jgi:hypothetical protein
MKHTYEGTKAFLNGWKTDLFFVNFGQFPCSWIWFWIQESQINADPDHNTASICSILKVIGEANSNNNNNNNISNISRNNSLKRKWNHEEGQGER